jgi:hypothetical protein
VAEVFVAASFLDLHLRQWVATVSEVKLVHVDSTYTLSRLGQTIPMPMFMPVQWAQKIW